MTTTLRQDGAPMRSRTELMEFLQTAIEVGDWPTISADDLREVQAALAPAPAFKLRDYQIATVENIRATFEAAYRAEGYNSIMRDAADEYVEPKAAAAWWAWQNAPKVDRAPAADAEGQPVWIVNDDRGEHVMMCPKAPTPEAMESLAAKIERNVVVLPFVLYPANRAAATSAVGQDSLDAARWRALLGSARIRIIGSAGIKSDVDPNGNPHNGYAHFGMEIWTIYGSSLRPEQLEEMRANNESARELLTKYADIARAAQAEKGGAA